MDAEKIFIIVAFLVGAGFSLYILTHLKTVIEHVNQWRAASIGALCISAFLFFAISHPKITKVVADVFGAKVQLNALNIEIDQKKREADSLGVQVASSRNELEELKRKLNETNIVMESKALIASLKENQLEGNPVVRTTDNKIAVNPKLAAKASGLKEIPEKFQNLSSDSWVVIPNGAIVAPAYELSGQERSRASSYSRRSAVVLKATGEGRQIESLTASEAEFLKRIIKNNAKEKGKNDLDL